MLTCVHCLVMLAVAILTSWSQTTGLPHSCRYRHLDSKKNVNVRSPLSKASQSRSCERAMPSILCLVLRSGREALATGDNEKWPRSNPSLPCVTRILARISIPSGRASQFLLKPLKSWLISVAVERRAFHCWLLLFFNFSISKEHPLFTKQSSSFAFFSCLLVLESVVRTLCEFYGLLALSICAWPLYSSKFLTTDVTYMLPG